MMPPEEENERISIGTYLRELKSSISLWEDIVLKSQKLNVNLKCANESAYSVIDSVSLLCSSRRSSFTGLDRVAQLLSEITVTEKYFADKMSVFNKAVQGNLVVNLSQQIESFRRSVTTIRKERDIKGRKAKIVYKKSLAEVVKLEKKINKHSGRKQSLSDTMSVQIDYANQDLQNKERFVDELDRCALRKAICEERNRYRLFVEFLRPVLEAQLSIRDDLDQLQRIYEELYSAPIFDLTAVPSEVETYVQQYHTSDQSRSNSICSSYSRRNSQLSLASSTRSKSVVNGQMYSPSATPNSQENLDTSSSTLLNKQNKSVIQDEELSDDDDLQRTCAQEKETSIEQTTLYPNQAVPAPRYCNLRQLKQNADKKYGLSTLSRNTYSSNMDNHTLPRNTPLFYNSDDSLLQCAPPSHYNDVNFSQNNPVSKYSNFTLTRHNQERPITFTDHQHKDNDIYTSISQIYGTPSLLPEVSSGTSTFKRRKPSNVTAMETPKITDKKFYQSINSDKLDHRHEDDFMNILRIGTNGDNPDSSQTRYSADLSSLTGYSVERISRQNEFLSSSHNDIAVNRGQQRRNINISRDIDHRLSDTIDAGAKVGELLPFKQQLLQVIQTNRPYHKPMSPVSSRIF